MKISNGKIQALALCGILSPIVYVVTVVLGGILDPSYSHIGKTVSELVERGAPNRDLLNVLLVFIMSSLFHLQLDSTLV
ncbi:MAG TPA: hypothetical protein VF350_05630 [Candidatus Bathyarchaeia archaeon]